jgi:DUF971 family protein
MWIKIDKNLFLSYLQKLKEKGIEKVKVSIEKYSSATIVKKENVELQIEKIEEYSNYAKKIRYDTKYETIYICVHYKVIIHIYIIDDENFDELKEIAKAQYVVEQL